MGTMSIWHWLLVGLVAMVFFGGKGKISDLMGDLGRGITSFKKGMADEAAAGSNTSTDDRAIAQGGAHTPRG